MIAVLGDTHLPRGGRTLPAECLALLRESSAIVHTGDFTSRAVLELLQDIAPVYAVHGNVDEPEVRALLPERLVAEVEGLRIGVVHDGGRRLGREARLSAWFPDCDLIAYGHSHMPEVEIFDGCWIVNPGSPTERRRAPAHTMVVVEAGVPTLIRLE